ncbi:MAG: hypothetical protein CYPHOPRED_000245 [Cyphobasidiales sp. Tagirdzhanova-0007]|nr:MAG: hypothetical protein CYPHOPRED_000245 [Cyphobasidiales sp. Tagirdzhanova-0007]
MADDTPIIELAVLSVDEEAAYIAPWFARAFALSDPLGDIATGKSYAQDPLAHTLFFQGYLIRNSLGGTVLTTPDRNAIVMRFRPGEAGKGMDFDWRSGRDTAWDAFVEHCGGREQVAKRIKRVRGPNGLDLYC